MSLSFVNKNHWQYSSFSSLEFRLPNKNHYSSSGGKGEGLWEIPLFPYTLALEECRSEGILGRVFEVLQSWVPFVNYKLAPSFVFDKYKPHFVFHKLVPISSLVWSRDVSRCGSLASGVHEKQVSAAPPG